MGEGRQRIDPEKVSKSLREWRELINQCILPIVYHQSHDSVTVVGTATVINVGPFAYLVSASHVYDDWRDRELVAYSIRQEISLCSPTIRIACPGKPNGEHEVSAWPVTGKGIAEGYDCSDWKCSPPELAGEQALFLGFPAKKNERVAVPAGRFQLYPTQNTFARSARYSEFDYSQATNVIVDYDRREAYKINGEVAVQEIPPKLQGMSGGGIFYLSRTSPDARRHAPQLVAISTCNPNKKIVVGAFLGHVLREIKRQT